jgi:hypothetical protein
MQVLRRRTFLGVLVAGGVALSGTARADDGEDTLSLDYVQRRRARLDASDVLTGDVDKFFPGATILWVVPPNLLLSRERQPSLEYVDAGAFRVRSAHFWRRLAQAEVDKIARASPDAVCDPSGDWFAYRAARAVAAKQKVLALPSRPDGMLVGMYRGAVPVSVWTRDFGQLSGSRARSRALLSYDKRFRICLYAAYDQKTAEVRRFSRVLCDADWKLLARDDDTFSAGATWCDGCAAPTYSEGVERVFGTFNMLTVEPWPHPLLVSDVSTIENRNIEIGTFLGDGRFGRHLISENFSACPSLRALLEPN